MGTGSFGRELDLRLLIDELEKTAQSPFDSNFTSEGMVTIYFGDDSPAYTVYRTGSFQIRGAKTETDLKEAESQLRTLLSDVDVEMPDYEFRHVTSVFIGTLDTDVNLGALCIALGLENTEYEPEQFPAIIYRSPEFAVTLLVFSTGKIIVVGTTDREKAESALQHLEQEVAKISEI